MNTKTKTLSQLRDIVSNDSSLTGTENSQVKMKYLAMASLFEENFLQNISKDSLDLSEKYPDIPPQEWLSFLTHPSVKKYIDGFLNERAEKQAMKALGESQMKAGDALKVKADIDSKKDRVDNSNIVVWFLPRKKYNYEDENNDGKI
jgi:hypothetical protein